MIRISTIFIAICMVLVSASLGLVLYSVAGISGSESAIVALAALTFLILYNAVSMRLRDRTDVGNQIADLSRGTADLARQVAEFGRRLSAIEAKMASANSSGADRIQAVVSEINELGGLVKQLAASVANHEELLAEHAPAPADATVEAEPAAKTEAEPQQPTSPPQPPAAEKPPVIAVTAPKASDSPAPRGERQILAALRSAVEENRLDLYLQPIVTLPQRKVRFYEAVTRLRDERDQILPAEDFIGLAEAAGLIGRVDQMVIQRCVQVLRRLMVRNKDVGVFCNVAAATLANAEIFSQCLDFLEANRALAPSFILEFKQSMFRNLGPVETEHLAALAQRGYRFSIDHVTDLRLEPRELADRGVRYIKVPAALLLDPKQSAASDIHPTDLSDLLGRFGIDLIAERIEGERSVVDLLDYDMRFGQGFLFAPPRPLRPEGAANAAAAANAQEAKDEPKPETKSEPKAEPKKEPKLGGNSVAKPSGSERAAAEALSPRMTGNAALVRRVAGPA
ncbi:EAL domain-containing protein [Bradyrhizobium sp. ARR65]|uniref:EAL domain-containing protein n=1 Tax=Bradyrhizobium sp. ARR65 TaxID=1040989 RepID=UPI000466284A|nr:EAL domain-containing protein [Bradyrhizobium sp. ARR65]